MGGISSAIGDATGQGGKGGFGAPQQSGGQPQMGFGFNPNTDMPFSGQQPIDGIASSYNPAADLNKGLNFGGMAFGSGLNSAFGGLPGVMPLVNTAGQVANTALGGMANGIQGNQPANAELGAGAQTMLNSMNDMLIRPGLFSGNGQQPMPTSGMGGGKNSFLDPRFINPVPTNPMFIDGNGNPTNDHGGGRVNMNINQFNPAYTPPQGPQIGFGPAPIEQNPMDIFGLPGAQNYNRQSPIIGSMPAPQPVNRFAPPNAPGVRQQPRTAPRAGIPVQSARTVQPNRFTRSRTR